jgi:hypothetical protein
MQALKNAKNFNKFVQIEWEDGLMAKVRNFYFIKHYFLKFSSATFGFGITPDVVHASFILISICDPKELNVRKML